MTAPPPATLPGLGSPISIGLLEIASLALGYAVADRLVKTATVMLHEVAAVSPGKLCILYSGGVAELELAHAAGLALAGEELIDALLLPRVDPQLPTLLEGRARRAPGDALGLFECSTVAAGIRAADAAAKATGVLLLELRRARGIGGRSLLLVTGSIGDVDAALTAGCAAAREGGAAVRPVLIAGVHEDLRRFLSEGWGVADGTPSV